MSDADRRAAARTWAAAPRTIFGLHLALKARLGVLAAAFVLDNKDEPRSPLVVDGWLPPKEAADTKQFPFLIARPKSGVDSPQSGEENSTATFEIIAGTYSDTDDAWLDVVSLIDAIRADLGAAPVLDGTAYEQVGPLAWTIPEEQPRPQWFGVVTTIWQMPRPQRVEARNPEGF